MNRRKFISAVPAAILLAQRPSAVMAQNRKKGVMLMNRIGPSSSELYIANADEALDDETVRKRFAALGSDGLGKAKRGQQALATTVKSEIARWTPIIKAANIKAE